MRVVSVLGFKGGVGKTVLATGVAVALAQFKQQVVVIDGDRQGNASGLLGGLREPSLREVLMGTEPIERALVSLTEQLALVPSHGDLDHAAHAVEQDRLHLAREVARLPSEWVFIDLSPSYTPITAACLCASTYMLLPVTLDHLAMGSVIDIIEKLKRDLPHRLQLLGIVPSMHDKRVARSAHYLAELTSTFGERVLPSIRIDENVQRAVSFGRTVLDYDPNARASDDLRAVAWQLIERTR